MTDNQEKIEVESEAELAEVRAEEELLKFGIPTLPENIQAVIDQQKTMQHPEGFEDIANPENFKGMASAMKEKNINHVIHFEGQSTWIHAKLAIRLVEFLKVSEEMKNDLKLIMLYHDLGKTTPGMKERPEVKEIQVKELGKGKLYQVAKGHADERLGDIQKGFEANGITGRKLEIFMYVVKNHMNFINKMEAKGLTKMFEKFGENDEERKEVAELLAYAQQVDSNATSHAELFEDGEIGSSKVPNTTGFDFDKIWAKYLEGKK
jgi:hypothetical protein